MSGSAAAFIAGAAGTDAFGASPASCGAAFEPSSAASVRCPPSEIASWVEAGAALASLPISAALSPSCNSTAIGVLTFTPSVPSATRILPSVPSSTASTSIVALSVSISAMTSPAATLSPSFFNHLETLPSSMVGERAGMRISIGMSLPSLKYDVGPELGRIRLRVVLGKFRGVGDNVADLLVDGLELVLTRPFLVEQPCFDLLDRITFGAHLLHFFLGAVFCRIRHRMAAVAIGLHFEDERPVAGAAPLGGK